MIAEKDAPFGCILFVYRTVNCSLNCSAPIKTHVIARRDALHPDVAIPISYCKPKEIASSA